MKATARGTVSGSGGPPTGRMPEPHGPSPMAGALEKGFAVIVIAVVVAAI